MAVVQTRPTNNKSVNPVEVIEADRESSVQNQALREAFGKLNESKPKKSTAEYAGKATSVASDDLLSRQEELQEIEKQTKKDKLSLEQHERVSPANQYEIFAAQQDKEDVEAKKQVQAELLAMIKAKQLKEVPQIAEVEINEAGETEKGLLSKTIEEVRKKTNPNNIFENRISKVKKGPINPAAQTKKAHDQLHHEVSAHQGA